MRKWKYFKKKMSKLRSDYDIIKYEIIYIACNDRP